MSDSNPKRASENEIPILDAQSIVSNDDISLLAKSVREACQNMGFFYVKNHGISQIIIDMHNLCNNISIYPIFAVI